MKHKKLSFSQIFRNDISSDAVIPRKTVCIGCVQISPKVKLGKGVLFGGIDITNYQKSNFQVEKNKGILVITGIF